MATDKRFYGDRTCISVRVPDDQYSTFESLAARENLSLGAWAAKQLAQASGLPIPEFVHRQALKNRQLEEATASDAA